MKKDTILQNIDKSRTYVRRLMNICSWPHEHMFVAQATPLLRRLLMLLVLVLGVTAAWGQTDYSGTYYIGSVGYNASKPTENYYLCPAEGWCYYKAGDNIWPSNTQEENRTMPFLTTYQCRSDAYHSGDASDAVWTIEKAPAPNDDYYYIKQASRYLTSNGQISGAGIDRLRVHLEAIDNPNDAGNKILFDISPHTKGYLVISPQGIQETGTHDNVDHSTHRWLVVNGGNKLSLKGESGKTGGPSGYANTAGIIGIYTMDDTNAPFYLEVPAPTISHSDGIVSISHEFTDVDIYYTVDGSNPTATSMPYDGTGFTPEINRTQVKAIAISRVSGIKSTVVTYNLPKLDAPTISVVIPNPSDVTSSGTATISTTVDGATIYYTKGDNPGDPKANSSTTTGDVSFTGPTIIKARVGKVGYAMSDVTTKQVVKVATPTFRDNGNLAIVIECETPGAAIHYTYGDTEPAANPDESSTLYTGPLTGMKDKYIKAIAIKNDNYNSEVASSGSVTFKCAKPVIRRISSDKFTITCSSPSNATIHYSIGDGTPTSSDTGITSGTAVSISGNLPLTIKAIAMATGFDNSDETTLVIRDNDFTGSGTAADPYQIVTSSDFSRFVTKASTDEGASASYVLTADISASGITSSVSKTFIGTFDGDFHTITGYGNPLFSSIDGGKVKNVLLDPNTTVSGNGAICNEADGSTKIYNCGVLSGTVSGSGNVGGLVGHINSGSSVRVVNCYNFATVSGGSTMAGIVGNNEGTVGNVRIAMCMMYGNMSGGTSPVYAGNHIPNVQNYTEYNYWRSKANLTYTTYNDQLAIDKDESLTRFPFYRHILNTHRELAAFFLFGESGETVNNITSDEIAEIGHWVLKKDVAPYPIVEEWKTNTKRTTEDIKNNLPNTTEKGAGKLLNNIGDDGYYTGDGTKITAMGSSGYLTVNVTINGTDCGSVDLPITDMNENNYDYTWGKVVLPFANEFSGWTRDYDYVCTGWEITAVGDVSSVSVSNYNFADRDNKNKDIYDATNNPYIFAQGGNYIVPYGVSTISINAHFAKAFYLSDPTYEVGYKADYTGATPLGGNVYNSTQPYYHGKKVYTSLSDLVTDPNYTTATNPHEQAIVLVGNYHFNINLVGASDAGDGAYTTPLNLGKAVTIMSTDEDNNQEPDYGWYTCNTKGRINVPPIRFDFLPNIEMGMSSRVGSGAYPGIGIWHTRGWFEQTETCVSNMSQCEINSCKFSASNDGKGNNRWIANSGCFVQVVRARKNPCVNLSYIQIGGNAYVKELYPGCHSDDALTNTSVPIVVTGGQVDECYMTGYNAGGKLNGDIRFWCAGGKIKKFLGAYLEDPTITTGTTAGVTAKVDHALIGRFFGGGTSVSARIKGNIDITINNSQVDFYCGGPEFGDIGTENSDKTISYTTVTTHATGTTFGEYYGAGFGGTSVTYNKETDIKEYVFPNDISPFPLDFSNYKRLEYKEKYGIGTCYKFEYIYHSSGSKGVARFHTGYAQFSLATTGAVTNVLANCIIKKLPGINSLVTKETSGEFYGAGCQGKVSGTVTSTLTNCTIERNAFGGGYKAESNEVEVYPNGDANKPAYSEYTKQTGIFSEFGKKTPNTFTWVQGTSSKQNTYDDCDSNGQGGKLYTSADIPMSELGNVTGAISLTIDGGYVGGTAQGMTPALPATASTEAIPEGGNVYGGGNESKSLNNTTVTLKGSAHIYGNVFGGGNEAEVQGSATVNIE